jgi:hypothetical protein
VRKCFSRISGTGCVLSVLLANQAASRTPVLTPMERIAFNRPGAWALKYFTSTTLLTGLDTPRDGSAPSYPRCRR